MCGGGGSRPRGWQAEHALTMSVDCDFDMSTRKEDIPASGSISVTSADHKAGFGAVGPLRVTLWARALVFPHVSVQGESQSPPRSSPPWHLDA